MFFVKKEKFVSYVIFLLIFSIIESEFNTTIERISSSFHLSFGASSLPFLAFSLFKAVTTNCFQVMRVNEEMTSR